jgi:hypothetical protein
MADLIRVSIVGTNGGDVWSVNPVYSVGGDFGTPVSQTQCQIIATAIGTGSIPTNLLTMWTQGTALTGFKVEARSKTGALESLAEYQRTAPLVGTGTFTHQQSSAVVSSLRTALPGASGRGRLYWPATGVPLQNSTMRLTTANALTYATAFKTFLSTIQTAIDATLDGVALAVWSRKLDDLTVVNQIQVGDILDVQRRRRDTLQETYNSLSYP